MRACARSCSFFTDMDEDGSGLITYDELRHSVRTRLKVGKSTLTEAALKAVWCALDVDDSNSITAPELGSFLKRTIAKAGFARQATMHSGGSLLASDSASASMSNAIASQPTSEMRAELETAGVPIPADEEILTLSASFNEWLEAARKRDNKETHSWFK